MLLLASSFTSFARAFTVVQKQQQRAFAFRSSATTLFDEASSKVKFWSTDAVRTTFREYFEKDNGHSFVPSSACAPLNDPTLLFTNAGMNQFKPIFLGTVDPNSPMNALERAVNSQKCIRAGGKHNDLEDVGKDTYHHTFFEMLGTWSFGDYFKEEAIDMAWELLTKVYKLEPDRLYATYFEGDEGLGLEPDLEAKEFWLKYLPENRVIASNAKDNFWEMGDLGPCGPCTEIHYDRIGGRDASSIVNQDDPNVLEIWNIVFIQFNRDVNGLAPLPKKHIDTGMGLERLVSILQDKYSNYDIDGFQNIIKATEAMVPDDIGPYEGKLGEDDPSLRDTAYRVIADHARTLTFSLADGCVPSNEGRGYVLRRILRRGARYASQILKAEPGLLTALVPTVVSTYESAYPEIREKIDDIQEIMKEEEDSFASMLDRGIKHFESTIVEAGVKEVSGKEAFFLYDSLGFPFDLTTLMASEAGLTIDSEGFEVEMETQRQRSRDARNASRGNGDVRLEFIAEQTAYLSSKSIPATDDAEKFDPDVVAESEIMAIFTEDGFVDDIEEGVYAGLVLRSTSFYAEAGGQDPDYGTIEANDGIFKVEDVQTYGGYILHTGRLLEGSAKINGSVKCKVDYERRNKIAPNHTMTHVLNAGLRKVLGDGVEQRGSLCNEEKLRFDFSHKKALSLEELSEVEMFVRQVVDMSEPVNDVVMPLADAQKIDGVQAVFGEVYPDPVRVVSVGEKTVSVEFCGGTHISNTLEAGAFVLIEETAVAKGVRRISGITGMAAIDAIMLGVKMDEKVSKAESLDNDVSQIEEAAINLRKDLDGAVISAALKVELRGRLEKLQKKAVEKKKAQLARRVDMVLNELKKKVMKASAEGEKVVIESVDIGADGKAANRIVDAIKKVAPDVAFLGISEEDVGSGGKVLCFALVPEVLTKEGYSASDWIKATLEVCGGRGGGRPTNAQGQAPACEDISILEEAAQKFAEDKAAAVVE